MTATTDPILYELDDAGVATITLNRPDAANGMSLDLTRRLFEVAAEAAADPAVRAAVVTGQGRFFSAGGDLKSISAAGDDVGSTITQIATHLHSALARFARMNAPVIAAVNGIAAGAGFSLALACDLVIAAESATFTSAYTAAGLTPDGSSTYYLPRLVGLRKAMELMLLNRRLPATEALELGMVNEVVPDGEELRRATDLAAQLAAGPTLAYGGVKRLLRSSLSATLETQMEDETSLIAAMSATADGREGVAAFLEKRQPEFRGR
jgi:2-(1,2-epoxy-1,2-dihydrophenyl)acetyl-CoA isomerase